MRFLFVVDRFYPDVSANTVCCDNVLKQFKSLGHQVDVLTIKKNYGDNDIDFYNGSKVFRLETYHFYWTKKFKKDDWNKLPTIIRKIIGAFYKLKAKFNPLALNGYLDTVNVNRLYKLISTNADKYDGMLSFTEPFALQPICKKLMKKGIAKKWSTYMLDAFEYNEFHKDIKFNKKIKIVNSVFKDNCKIFVSDGILQEHMDNGYLPSYLDKAIDTHLPVLISKNVGSAVSGDVIKLVYVGTFYSDIRNPKEMLKVLSFFPENYVVDLYGSGCQQEVEQAKSYFVNSKLVINGVVDRNGALQKIKTANVLINLSNKNTKQVPSKVLEYIGVGKPIINFYFDNDDISLSIFNKYPLVYNFNLTNFTKKDVEDLIGFCNNNKYKQLTYEQATKNLEDFKIENLTEMVLKEF